MKLLLSGIRAGSLRNVLGRCGVWSIGVIAAAALLMATPRLMAQTAGSVSGHLADPQGASLAGADVTLTNVGQNTSRVTKSTSSGDYTFTEVPPGFYKIQVQQQGFKTSVSDAFEVQIAQAANLNFTLQVGAVTESVDVTAAGALLQVENPTLGTVVEHAELAELPLLNGRNYLGLVSLASNVNTGSPGSGQAGSRLGGERAGESIAVGGQRIMFDYYTLDGVVNTDPDFNTYVAQPSPDGIGEMKVQTGVYSAEFGHEASQINVMTKSGTNTFHGAAYDYIRNNYVDAQPYFFPERNAPGTHQTVTPFKYNDFGFELDGPVRIPKVYDGRNKFFFMVDTEWYRTRSSNRNASATVPTPAQASGNFQNDFYQWEDTAGVVHNQPIIIYDPTTHLPFPSNTITNVAPQSTALLQYLGTFPTAPTFLCPTTAPARPTNCSTIANYHYTTVANDNRYTITTRGDYNMSQKSQLAFRYSSGSEINTSTGLLGAGSKLVTNFHQYMGSNTYTFSPSVVNEVRFGYSYLYNSLAPLLSFTTDVVDKLGIPGLVGGPPAQWGIPSMGFGNTVGTVGVGTGTTPSRWSGFGDQGGDTPYVTSDPIWQIVDNVTWVKGKHSLRLGFEYNRQNFNEFGNQFLRGQFTSQALTTADPATKSGGDPLADLLLGNLQSSTVALAPANAAYVRNEEAAYVDDTYHLTPKLTISAGLRYELTPPWTDTLGDLFNTMVPVFPSVTSVAGSVPNSQWPFPIRQGNCAPSGVYAGLSFNWTTNGPLPTCNNGKVPNGPMMNTNYKNFAPRFGVSFSPNAKTVIRAGYGIFYTQDIGNAYFDMARNIAGRVSYTNGNATTPGGASTLTWANVSPFSTPGTISTLPLATVWYANAVSHHTSYTEQMLLNIQQQIGKNWSIEAGYQGALSRHLYGFLSANQVAPFGLLSGSQSFTVSAAPTGTCPGCTKATPSTVCSRTTFNCSGTASPQGIQFVHDEGMANYQSGSISVNRRFSHGALLNASYTLSKSLDDSSGIRNQGNDLLYPQNSLCVPCEYGPSAFDVRNRIVVTGLYELPIGKDKLVPINSKLLDLVIGGWQLGGSFSHQTGAVASPQMGSDNSGIASPFGNFDRPNVTGISPYRPCNTHTRENCANPAAYAKPGVVTTLTTQASPTAPIVTGPVNIGGLWGDAQRGSFHGPGQTNLNASLHKAFNMPYNEKHQLAIRFDVNNALNHPNWTTPNITFNSTSFGYVNAGGMRTMQLGAKYQF